MTAEEALPRVKALYMVLADEMTSEEIQPLGMAISALQKQIPVKMVTDSVGLTCCPSCGKVCINYDTEYCKRCGQKIQLDEVV